jgi:hypothetical protein
VPLSQERNRDKGQRCYPLRYVNAGDALILVLAAGEQAAEDAGRIAGAVRRSRVERLPLSDHAGGEVLPVPLLHWPKRFGLRTTSDVKALGKAIADMRRRAPRAEVASARFLPPLEACLLGRTPKARKT